MSARIEGHAKVLSPEWSVYAREVKAHLVEVFRSVWIGLDFEVSHLTQPKVHSLCSPVSILSKHTSITVDQRVECSSVWRHHRIAY
jgi:hypothetical protein